MKPLLRSVLLALLLAVAGALPAVEKSVADLLKEGSTGLIQFSFDWPRRPFAAALARATPGSEEWAHASYGLATCKTFYNPVSAASVKEATALFEGILAQAPDSRFAPLSAMALGRIAERVDFYLDPPDFPAAQARYRMIAQRWSDQPIAGEATLRLAGTFVSTNTVADAKTAITLLQDWLAAHPQDPLAAGMYQFMGDTTYLRLGDRVGSLPFYIKADELGLPSLSMGWCVLWRIASTAERDAKDRALAIRYYTKIVVSYQTSGKAFEAQMALARLGAPIPELSAFVAYTGPRPALPDPDPQWNGAAP